MLLSDRVGGKARGILILAGLGLPIPATSIVSRLPASFPELGAQRIIIRPSEGGGDFSDPHVAQASSGLLHSVVTDEHSWDQCRRMYDKADDRIAAFVLQPHLGYSLGLMGHTDVRAGRSYIAAAPSLLDLAGGHEPAFEAVLIDEGQRTFSRVGTLTPAITGLIQALHQRLPRLSTWPSAEMVEWEAAEEQGELTFLQCQASTAEIPNWSRP